MFRCFPNCWDSPTLTIPAINHAQLALNLSHPHQTVLLRLANMRPGIVWLLAMLAVTAQAQLMFESSEGDTKESSECRGWRKLSNSELTKEVTTGGIIGDLGHFICATNLRQQCKQYEHCTGCNYKFQYLGKNQPNFQNFRFEHTGEPEVGCPKSLLTGTGVNVRETDVLDLLRGGVLTRGCNCRVPGA